MVHFHWPPLQNNFDDGSSIIALAQYLPEKVAFVYEQGAKQGQKKDFSSIEPDGESRKKLIVNSRMH